MFNKYFDRYSRLFFAMLAMVMLSIGQPAKAADYVGGVEVISSQTILWMQGASITQSIAHYNVNGGAQQNVTMPYNSTRARYEVVVPATTGQTVNYQFTYTKSGLAYDSVWASAVVGSSTTTQVATPTFSPPGGTYTSAQNVTVSSSTTGATVQCSINGGAYATCPAPLTVSANTTVSAKAIKSGMTDSAVASATYTINTSTGGITQGVTDNGTSLTVWFSNSPLSSWVDIHYVLNGGTQQNVRMAVSGTRQQINIPVTSGAAVTLTYNFTYATSTGQADTASTTWTRSTTATAAAPTFSPAPGTYTGTQNVALASSTSGASIRYTLDGSTPTSASTLYSGPIAVSASKTIKAIAIASGMNNSAVSTGVYTINTVSTAATPTFSPAPGTYTGTQSVTLATATSGASIRYTLDGSTPTSTSTLYSGPISVAAPGLTVKAIALASGQNNSAVASGTYTINTPTVNAPTFSPAGGTYTTTQSVTLASSTAGAAIRYTLDGSTPTSASALYSGPISIAAPGATLKAIAIANSVSSSVSSATYTISSTNNTFSAGVLEDGTTAIIWNKVPGTPTTNIVHFYVTSTSGVKGAQSDVNMIYDSAAQRWVGPTISPVVSGSKLTYFFTYTGSTGGNVDSAPVTYTLCGSSSTCPGAVPMPVFNPATGGKVAAGTQVSLSLGSGSVTGSKIYYTLNGSPANASSSVYTGTPISINGAVTITAVTIQPDGGTSRQASLSFDVTSACDTNPASCPVAAPVFSHVGGSYSTQIALSMLTSTTGATIHYTLDGTTPTATSPQYSGAIPMSITTKGDTYTVKALATKHGANSSVVSATYKILSNNQSAWNGKTTFNIVNGTGATYADSQVYWFMIGKDWTTHKFVRVDAAGNLIPMSEGDNTIAVPGRDKPYANYAITLAQAKSVTIPPIESARIYLSVGKPVLIQVNTDINGNVGYAGPNLENSTDPNIGVRFDFAEFNINQQAPVSTNPGIYVNTSRVDIFGLPIKLRVTGLDGYDSTVGESLTETRDELISRFMLETPNEFHSLAQTPYAPNRIMAPAHATFGVDGPNAHYLDAYITQVWNMYRTQDLIINTGNGWPTFTGRVGPDNVLTFNDGVDTYKIYGQPTTQMVMLGNGLLDDGTGTTPNTLKHDKQLQLQAQICAALNRHVADLPNSRWYDGASFFPAGSAANWYTKFWHEHSINGLAYGFSYDDVGSHSPSIYTPAPTTVTFTIGK